MTIWKDTPVRIFHKTKHIKKMKENFLKNFFRTGFTKDCGDLPVRRFNEITEKMEEVVNNRGYGYAKRKDIKYRKRNFKRIKEDLND